MAKQTIIIVLVFIILIGLIATMALVLNWPKEPTTESNVTSEPKEILQKFIEADMAGARLGGKFGEKAPDIKKYVIEPFVVGDFIMIIKKYEITDEVINDNSYRAKVKFFCEKAVSSGDPGFPVEEVFGGIDEGFMLSTFSCSSLFQIMEGSPFVQFNYENETETVNLELVNIGKEWKIKEPIPIVHISEETFQKYISK